MVTSSRTQLRFSTRTRSTAGTSDGSFRVRRLSAARALGYAGGFLDEPPPAAPPAPAIAPDCAVSPGAPGCAPPDGDGDGIPDATDACINEPEDLDGFEDAEGCPEPDNDGDGQLDVE